MPLNKPLSSNKNYTPHENFITTTEFAKVCGVSRFTIINWVKQSRIKTIKTVGGHRRIPIGELILFLEKAHLSKDDTAEKLQEHHCWNYKSHNKSMDCRNCLIYKKEIVYCFMLSKHLDKSVTGCEGSCSECSYFENLFNKEKSQTLAASRNSALPEQADKKQNTLFNIGFGLGHNIKGMQKGLSGIKNIFTTKRTSNADDTQP